MKITITIEETPMPSAVPEIGPAACCYETHRPVAPKRIGRRLHLTTRNVVDRLGVSRAIVRALVHRGELPKPAKIGGRLAFDRKTTQRAIAELKRRAKLRGRGFPTSPPAGRRIELASPPYTTFEVARLLHIDPQRTRELARRGAIKNVWKASGQLLFDRESVRAFVFEWNRKRERNLARPRLLRLPKGRT